jgi:hypothetical protein
MIYSDARKVSIVSIAFQREKGTFVRIVRAWLKLYPVMDMVCAGLNEQHGSEA